MQKWVQAILHRARAERAHVLDLGNCGLASFPEQVFDLPDLEVLVLGPRYYVPGKDAVVQSANHGPTNTIPELPDDLQHLPNLRSLSLADNPITTIEPLRHAHRLVQLDISSTRVSRIDCLAALPQLTHLSLGSYYATMPFVRAIQTMPHHFREGDGITKLFPPPVADLTVLAMLSGLVVLDLSLAAKPDLVRLLRDLKSLRDLDLTGVDLQELGDLPSARALERMILDLTAISDVSSIAHLAALKELSLAQCSLDRVDAIARLTNLDRLNLLGFVGDLRPLTTLPHLTELTLGHERLLDYTSMRQPNDGPAERATLELSPLTSLASLEALTLRCIRHVDIYPIALLPNLSRLVIDECGVDHVNALGAATGLTALTLEDSGIDDISVLQDLSLLKYLRLDRNPIADLSPLSHLNSLQDLSVRRTHALDLSPISGLLGLEHLDVSETPLADLSAITALHALTTLSFDQTKVTDISVVSLFDQLKTLSLRNTAVADIGPVASLQQLEVLNIHACPMVDLQPLAEIPHLRRVDAGYCKLSFYPRYLLSHPRLYSLSLAGNPITDCPPEIFGHQLSEDNLAAARAHFADLEHGQTEDRELKLLILGNGRVGKTSLLRRLVHGTFDPDEESTHGIRTETWDLAVDGAPVRLNIWDFGGQDIYFGTHALFQSSGTIFLIVWDAATEQAPFHEHGALRFENRPLSFWIEYVEHLRPGAQVVIIENKCDGRRSSPLPADPRGKTTLGFSARTGHGAGTLTEWLRDTCQAELGASRQIGVGRHAVKTTIRSLQLADDRRPPAERQHRLMAYDDFLALCAAQTGRVSSSSALLTYLCDSGVLFHRDDLFDRQIILDQRWALDAIYALFDRQHCYRQLLDRGGRFRRTDLHDLVWHDLLSVPEQRLILSFMASCALAFEGDTPPGEEPVYIAPRTAARAAPRRRYCRPARARPGRAGKCMVSLRAPLHPPGRHASIHGQRRPVPQAGARILA
jgi:internalin A